jgi:hypothetical protein
MTLSSRPRSDDPAMQMHRQGASSDVSASEDRLDSGTADGFNPHALVDSLDEAVNKLRQASELSASGMDHFARWVGVIAAAKDQRTAVEKLDCKLWWSRRSRGMGEPFDVPPLRLPFRLAGWRESVLSRGVSRLGFRRCATHLSALYPRESERF